jgi:hypothetical protein
VEDVEDVEDVVDVEEAWRRRFTVRFTVARRYAPFGVPSYPP